MRDKHIAFEISTFIRDLYIYVCVYVLCVCVCIYICMCIVCESCSVLRVFFLLICIHLIILQLIVEAFLLYRNNRHLNVRKALLLLLACLADTSAMV